MNRSSILINTSLLLLIYGCVGTQPSQEKSTLIVWKTEAMRYADMGFVSDDSNTINIEIYGAGSALMRLKIGRDTVCMSSFECMSKREFNTQMLSTHYPLEILGHIFRGEEIFDGRDMTRDQEGFSQHIISSGKYDIHYSVTKEETLFRDSVNNIVIKTKNMD